MSYYMSLCKEQRSIVNPLSANPAEWSKHTQTICFSVFGHFVLLAPKGLKLRKQPEDLSLTTTSKNSISFKT